MKLFYSALAALSVAFALPAAAQSLSEQGCATVTTPAEIQRIYDFVQHHPEAYYQKKGTDAVDTLPLTIHIVGKDDGTGYYSRESLLKVLCSLNDHYAPAHIYFAVQWPIRYINKSSYYEHTSFAGGTMMMSNNVANTINIYFVKDPAGACGYYAPWADGVAINNSCAAPNSTTLVHELGHFLSLPHTFYGWEGGVTPSNPEKVTRGAGANCNTAGDGFCDTDADWQAERWNCPYTGTQTDQTGVPYKPDSSLYMGYPTDNCMSRFSNMQIAAMHYNINTARSGLYAGPFSDGVSLGTPAIASPVDTMYVNYKRINWHPAAGANQYRVTLAPKHFPNLIRMEAITGDTTLLVTPVLSDGVKYLVKIEPMNSVNVCRTSGIMLHEFTFSDSEGALSVAQAATLNSKITLSPNPVSGNMVTLQLEGFAGGDYQVAVISLNGQTVFQKLMAHPGGTKQLSIPVSELSKGLYFVRINGRNGVWTEKLSVQ